MHECIICTIKKFVILVPQVLVSMVSVNEPIEVSENERVDFCISVWGALTEAVHVLVETTDSELALGESVNLTQLSQYMRIHTIISALLIARQKICIIKYIFCCVYIQLALTIFH